LFVLVRNPVSYADSLDDLARPQTGRSRRATSTARLPNGDFDPDSNRDNSNVKPGATKVLADLKGPGEITHVWMTFLGPEPHPWARNGAANHQEMLLRIFWDGREQPDVEAPVGEFFACGFGERTEIKSEPVIVDDGDSYNCFWRMPFRKSARVEIVNQSDKDIALLYYNIDWIEKPVAAAAPYFCARYNQEYPTRLGRDYLIADIEGKGHYVGTVLAVRSRSPEWFGEGDEKGYVDGETTPSIQGTGTEDYFLAAWGLQRNSTPYFGTPLAEDWGILGQRTVAYRWHLHDPIVFNTRLRFTIEHFGWISPDENPKGIRDSWNEREDDFASVAFWYQAGPSKRFGEVSDARGRRVPSLDVAFTAVRSTHFSGPAKAPAEAGTTNEDRLTSWTHGSGEASLQKGPLWPEGGQLFFKPESAAEGWVEIPFEVKEREPRRLIVRLTRSYDYGRYQPSLDGVKLGAPIDLYSAETAVKEYPLLDFWPEAGRHVLRLERVGRNDRATGDYLGVVSVLLRERRPRVKDYGYDRDKDWKKNPILY
jgi:hypothetical protein